jgi:uncharacterized protein YkwD
MITLLLSLALVSARPVAAKPPVSPEPAVATSPAAVRHAGLESPVSSSMSADILRLVNEHRRAIGLKSLQADSYISSVALGHSRDMLSGKTPFGHEGFQQRIDLIRKHLGPLHVAAENVASGPMSAREVVDGWLHSAGHRRNIEGDFRLTGIGVATARNGMIYFTQIFTK